MDTKGLAERLTALQKRLDDLASTTKIVISEVVELQAQLAEAEKPGLEHGDYGLVWDTDDCPSRFIYLRTEQGKEPVMGRACAVPHIHPWYHVDDFKRLIFGNLFKELKELAKPLQHFKADVHEYTFNVAKPDFPILIAGNWHTLPNAEAMSTDIQRVINTYKQTLLKQK